MYRTHNCGELRLKNLSKEELIDISDENGNVIDEFTTIIDVRKVGLERFLFNMSRENPLAYGLMSIAIAIFAGWAASLLFRFFRAT